MLLGRTRFIENKETPDIAKFTTDRTDGKDSKQDDVDRSEAETGQFIETKLLNFYSCVGLNFQNIASNDAVITSKIMDMVSQGWDLAFTMSGVESDSGKVDGKGTFTTRLILKRKK
jgi:hypothetical protein